MRCTKASTKPGIRATTRGRGKCAVGVMNRQNDVRKTQFGTSKQGSPFAQSAPKP